MPSTCHFQVKLLDRVVECSQRVVGCSQRIPRRFGRGEALPNELKWFERSPANHCCFFCSLKWSYKVIQQLGGCLFGISCHGGEELGRSAWEKPGCRPNLGSLLCFTVDLKKVSVDSFVNYCGFEWRLPFLCQNLRSRLWLMCKLSEHLLRKESQHKRSGWWCKIMWFSMRKLKLILKAKIHCRLGSFKMMCMTLFAARCLEFVDVWCFAFAGD